MLVLATTVFGLSFVTYGADVLPFFAGAVSCSGSPRDFGCALVLRLGPASEWLVWPVPALLSPFPGFYPLVDVATVDAVDFEPAAPSYVFEGIARIVAGGTVSGIVAGGAAALAVVYIFWPAAISRASIIHAQRPASSPGTAPERC